MNRDELAARLLETFVAELEDQVAMLDRYLLVLESQPEHTEERRAVFRIMHTLKGAARAAGVASVEATCHRLEALLAQVRDDPRPLDAAILSQLFQGVSELSAAAEQLRASTYRGGVSSMNSLAQTQSHTPSITGPSETAQQNPDHPAPKNRGDRMRDSVRPRDAAEISIQVSNQHAAADDVSSTTTQSVPAANKNVAPSGAEPPGTHLGTDIADATNSDSNQSSDGSLITADVRVRAEQLYALLSASSRLLMTSGRITGLQSELEQLRSTLSTIVLRHGDQSVYDRAREIQESLRTVVRDVTRLTIESSEAMRQLAVVTADLNLGVRSLRLRPFSDAVSMLPRLVRDAAAETGKEVHLEIEGNEIEADRTVLDEMREAVLHLARNAVAHGIESPSRRVARGKSATGTVRVNATIIVDHIVVTVSDDGAGLDVPSIRAVLQRQGESVPADDTALIRRLFEGGISTRDTADSIAGRGVGLDAVRASLARIRGTVDVSWRPGEGTTFTLEAPVALATIRAVLVNLGTHVVAIPDAYIQRLVYLEPNEVRIADGRTVIPYGDVPVPLVSLARLLGPPMTERGTPGTLEVAIVTNGVRRLGLAVDRLAGEEEIVIRPILSRGKRELPFISGAALLRSGKVALVANVGALMAAGLRDSAASASPTSQMAEMPARRRILVVDDSITTRTLEQSVLEMAGYDVGTAVDGADGWRFLQEHGADLVVSDVEMPRMDGFVLCQTIRASNRFRDIPVILVTALETQEDRERGIEAGADAYLTKSSFDQQTLLDTIRQLIG